MLITVLCLIFSDCTALVVYTLIFASVGMILSMIFRFRAALTCIAACIGIVLSCLLLLNAQYRHDKTLSLCDGDCTVEAVVKENPEFSHETERYYTVAEIKSLNSEKAYGKIRISLSETKDEINPSDIKIGDKLSFSAYVYEIASGSEEAHNSFKAKNIFLGAYSVKNLVIEKAKIRPLAYYTSIARDKMKDILSFHFGNKTAGLLIALLTGDKDNCPEDVYLNFKRSGVAHIMAVSGLHLTIWITILSFCFRYIKTMKKLQYAVMLLVVIFIVYIADFSASVCRAAIMITVYLLGRMSGKEADSLNSLGLALICILSANPYAIYSVSFQLSFACVFSIIVIGIPLTDKAEEAISRILKYKILKKVASSISDIIIISLTVSTFTFPICAYHFGYVSLLSPISNLLLLFACAPLMALSGAFVVLSKLPFLSVVLFWGTKLLSEYMLFITEKLASMPLSTIPAENDEKIWWLIIVAALSVIVLLRLMGQKYYSKAASLMLVFLVIFGLLHMIDKRTDEYKIKVLGSGQDYAAVVIFSGKAVLIGSSEDYYFTDELGYVLEAENAKLVAVVPEKAYNERKLEYLCADFGAESIIYENESVELFDRIFIENRADGIFIRGNGKTTGFFYTDYLQDGLACDIIIGKNGVIRSSDGESLALDEGEQTVTVYIDKKGEVKVRGESFWLNLMKKN